MAIVSSMVTEQIADKCRRQVGVDSYLSTQDLRQVAAKLDEVCGAGAEVVG